MTNKTTTESLIKNLRSLAIHSYSLAVPILEEAADRLEELHKRTVWQPIATAPVSNGSETFLCFIKGHGCVVAYKLGDDLVFNASKQLKSQRNPLKPTHFMPLPTPPQNKE